jgi:hypothetical protein
MTQPRVDCSCYMSPKDDEEDYVHVDSAYSSYVPPETPTGLQYESVLVANTVMNETSLGNAPVIGSLHNSWDDLASWNNHASWIDLASWVDLASDPLVVYPQPVAQVLAHESVGETAL